MNPVALRRVAGIPVKLNLQFKLVAADWETTQNAITAQAGSAPYAVRLTTGQLDRPDDVTGLVVWRVAGFVVHRDIAYAVERQNGAHGFRGKTRGSGAHRNRNLLTNPQQAGWRSSLEGEMRAPVKKLPAYGRCVQKSPDRPHLTWFVC